MKIFYFRFRLRLLNRHALLWDAGPGFAHKFTTGVVHGKELFTRFLATVVHSAEISHEVPEWALLRSQSRTTPLLWAV